MMDGPPSSSYSHYQDLSNNQVGEMREGSSVVEVMDVVHNNNSNNNDQENTTERVRLLHLASFMPITLPGSAGFDRLGRPVRAAIFHGLVNWDAAALVAMIHFNRRDGSVVWDLPQLLHNCNLRLTMELRDTQLSPNAVSKQLYQRLWNDDNHGSSNGTTTTTTRYHGRKRKIGAVTGSVTSAVSKALGVLTGVEGIPYVSPAEASSYFDDHYTNAPSFLRTVPSNSAYARAAVELLRHWNVSHVGLLYTLDEYGLSFLRHVTQATSRYPNDLSLTVAGYRQTTDGTDFSASIRLGLEEMKGLRYFIGIGFGDGFEVILANAVEMGLATPDHVWLFPQVTLPTNPNYAVPRNQSDFAHALQNTILIDMNIPPHQSFVREMVGLKFNRPLQSFLVQSHPEPEIWDTYNWTESVPILTTTAYTNYDAVMAIGIAACQQPKRFFSGQELYQQLLSTEFDGLSGRVRFDSTTGSRRFEGVQFKYSNIRIDEGRSDAANFRFRIEMALVLNQADHGAQRTTSTRNNNNNNQAQQQQQQQQQQPTYITELVPLIFRGGSTTPPLSLPPILEVDQHLVPSGLRIFAWGIATTAMILAIGLGLWTAVYRNNRMVRLSQPTFLGMICVGTFLMASSVLFLGWHEPWPSLDAACMVTPWLLALGFSTAFSALFSKTWRINRLVQHGIQLRRVQLTSKDVLWPCLLMTATNVGLLLAWTLNDPLEWTRTDDLDNRDQYGRPVGSYGSCRGRNRSYFASLVVFNFVVVTIANYQGYVGRKIPWEFNESYGVALSMAGLLECFLIGGPILFLVADNPSADFVVKSVIITFASYSILLPVVAGRLRKRRGVMDRLLESQSRTRDRR